MRRRFIRRSRPKRRIIRRRGRAGKRLRPIKIGYRY